MPDRLNDSYYRATAHGWETQRPLDYALDCDVAVIGGGFTGLSAALTCAEKGLKVALVEAQSIGFGASGRNGGQLIPGLLWTRAGKSHIRFGMGCRRKGARPHRKA
jgi:gamma-glutamylputrescine oxidase